MADSDWVTVQPKAAWSGGKKPAYGNGHGNSHGNNYGSSNGHGNSHGNSSSSAYRQDEKSWGRDKRSDKWTSGPAGQAGSRYETQGSWSTSRGGSGRDQPPARTQEPAPKREMSPPVMLSPKNEAKEAGGSGDELADHLSGDQNAVTSSKPKTRLNSEWTLWFHSIECDDWSLDSYSRIFIFNTVEDFWILYNCISEDMWCSGMFYLMREDCPPMWDAPVNKDGGAWTFKVDKRTLGKFWQELSMYCIGETLAKKDMYVSGISMSPKIRNATARIWVTGSKQDLTPFNHMAQLSGNAPIVIDFAEARFTANSKAAIK